MHLCVVGQLPTLGRALRPFVDDLSWVLSYRLLHDRLKEGFEIASSTLSDVRSQGVVNGSRDLRARSIKPFGGGRPWLRQMREVSVTFIMGFLSCTAVDKLWEKHTSAAARSCCITSRRIARGRPPRQRLRPNEVIIHVGTSPGFICGLQIETRWL